MFCAIIMPVFNEASHLDEVLKSFKEQTDPCDLLILVDDGSTDTSPDIMERWSNQHPWIELVSSDKKTTHAPGEKVVLAFNRGYEYLLELATKRSLNVSLIGKFDADIVLPQNYFATLKTAFGKNRKLGLASGLLYIKQNKTWVYEQIAKKQKVRGPIKLYNKQCFDEIGGLKACLGWDSIDQWLVGYWGWETQTFPELKVKHLKATGLAYDPSQLSAQGRAFAHMGYGFWLAMLSLLKLSLHYKKPSLLIGGLREYWRSKHTLMIQEDQAVFIRKTLWKTILNYR